MPICTLKYFLLLNVRAPEILQPSSTAFWTILLDGFISILSGGLYAMHFRNIQGAIGWTDELFNLQVNGPHFQRRQDSLGADFPDQLHPPHRRALKKASQRVLVFRPLHIGRESEHFLYFKTGAVPIATKTLALPGSGQPHRC